MSTEPSAFATETIVPFAIASAIAGGLVVVWAFFSSSLIGSLLGWFVKMMFKAKGVRVTFNSINIAPLSGTVALKGLSYTTENLSIRAVDGFVRVRWWLQHSKRSFDDSNTSRVEVELNGLDVQVYNNTPRYDQLRRALFKQRSRSGAADTGDHDPLIPEDDVVDLQELIPVDQYQPGLLKYLSPVLKIVVHKGSVLVGNPRIQPLLSLSFHSASIRYTNEAAAHPALDYFRTRLRIDFTHANCKLIENVLYGTHLTTPIKSFSTASPTQSSSPASQTRKNLGFQKFISKLKFGFMAQVHVPEESYHQIHDEEEGTAVVSEHSRLPSMAMKKETWKGLARYQDAVRSEQPLISAASITVEYYADSPGPLIEQQEKVDEVVEMASKPRINKKLSASRVDFVDDTSEGPIPAPEWGVIITASSGAQLCFGPKHNRLRAILQAFFFPALLPTTETPKIRQFEYFNVDLRLLDRVTFRIPFQDPNASTASSPTRTLEEWLELTCGAINMQYKVPATMKQLNKMQLTMDPHHEDQAHQSHSSDDTTTSESDSGVEMDSITDKSDPKITMRTSMHPDNPFVQFSGLSLDLTIDASEDPSQTSKWLIDTKIIDSTFFFLREHADLLARLGQDFAVASSQFSPSTHAESLASFKPTQYDIHLQFMDEFQVHLNMNERNIIDDLTSLKMNSFYTIKGPKLDASLSVPMLKYQQARLPIQFDVLATDLCIAAQHCETSTISMLFEKNESELSNFLSAPFLRLWGGYDYATGSNIILPAFEDMKPEVLIDYMELNVEADGAKMKALGAHLNMFDRFLDNYLGSYTKTTRSNKSQPTAVLPQHTGKAAPVSPEADEAEIPPPSRLEDRTSPPPTSRPMPKIGEPIRKTEVTVSVKVKRPTVSLPLNLYSDQISAVAKCREVLVDVRVGSDLIIAIGVSPATIFLPACGTTVVTKPIATLSRLSVELMWKKAKIPDPQTSNSLLDVNYRTMFKVSIGDVNLAVEPIHILRALDGVQQLFYHVFNRDNRPDYPIQVKNPFDELKHTSLLLSLGTVTAKVWGPRGVVQVTLPDGLKLSNDSLFTPNCIGYMRLLLPKAKVAVLTMGNNAALTKSLSTTELPEMEDWIESAAIDIPKVVLRFPKVLIDPSKSQHVQQLEFLRKADASRNYSLSYLWVADDELWNMGPSKRPWIRNFFESSPPSDTSLPSLVSRIFNKTETKKFSSPLETPKTAHSQPLRHSSKAATSSWRSLSRPSGPVSPLSLSDRRFSVSSRSVEAMPMTARTSRTARVDSIGRKASVARSQTEDSGSTSDSEFFSANSSEDLTSSSAESLTSSSSESHAQKPEPSKDTANPRPTKVKFDLPSISETITTPAHVAPRKAIEFPVSALLDHHAYDIQNGTDSDKLGQFYFESSVDLELQADPFGTPESVPALVVPDSPRQPPVFSPIPERKSSRHTKAHSSLSSSSGTKHKEKAVRHVRMKSNESHHTRTLSQSEPAIPEPADPLEEEKEPNWESNTTDTILVDVPQTLEAHFTPASVVVFADAIDHLIRERLTLQTLLDRMQTSLVGQMIVSSEGAGQTTFLSVLLRVAGVRICFLQTHIGDIATNYITSLSLGEVVFSMKVSTESIHPAVYANERYELPSLVSDTRSRDMSVTLSSSVLMVEQINEAYAKRLLLQPEPKDPVESSEPNSKVIFSATLTDSLQFLTRFVAPSYLATREAATFVNVGRVVGAIHEAFGSYLASVVRAWIPSLRILSAALSGLSDRGRLSHLVLYELLVQLRDVDVQGDAYDAFGTQSEAQRTAWMLICVTRQRLRACVSRQMTENRLVAGQVHSSTMVSVDTVKSVDALAALKNHHLPPLLAGCIDLDFYLHQVLSKDPDILGSHFLVDELFLKRAQTTRQRFNVHIQGLSLKLPSPPPNTSAPEDTVRSSCVLLPVDVTALTKISVRLPLDSKTPKPIPIPLSLITSSAPASLPTSARSRKSTVVSSSEDMHVSSSDPVNSTSLTAGLSGVRVLAPLIISETEFLVNSKGVRIHLTPKVLELGDQGMASWKASEHLQSIFDVRPAWKSSGLPVRLTLLEQMVQLSPEIWKTPSRDRHAISGHLVSDAFAVRASSRHGLLALDIPETTLTMSSLPEEKHTNRPASHTVILRLPVLKFSACIERRKRMQSSSSELADAPITLELSHLAACIMFTPSGISIFNVEGKAQEFRAHRARPSRRKHSKTSSHTSRPSTTTHNPLNNAEIPTPSSTPDSVFDALDVVVQFRSFTLPFRLPHPVYSQNFITEWYLRGQQPNTGGSTSTPSPPAPSVPQPRESQPVESTDSDTKKGSKPARKKKSRKHQKAKKNLHGEQLEEEPPLLPFLTRKVRATFHGHFENITFLMTQLTDLPVKYEIPEFSLLSRHAEHEHALHVSVKAHSISFEPKKTQVSVDSTAFDFVSTKQTVIELPAWTIDSTLRQQPIVEEEAEPQESDNPSPAKHSRKPHKGAARQGNKPEIRTDVQSSFVIHYCQNVLRANAIKNILVFQATLTREIRSVLAVLEEANKGKQRSGSSMTTSSSTSNDLNTSSGSQQAAATTTTNDPKEGLKASPKDAFSALKFNPLVRWKVDVDWKGLEFQVESPHATVMLYTGHLRGVASNLKSQGESQSHDNIARPNTSHKREKREREHIEVIEQNQGDHEATFSERSRNPFEFQVQLNHISAVLCPPSTKSRLYNKHTDCTETSKLDVWAGISSNFCIQSYHDLKFDFRYSSNAATHTGAFKTLWLLLYDTHVLVQPWVGEKALLMWLFFSEYHSTIVSRKSHATPDLQRQLSQGPQTSRPNILAPPNSTPQEANHVDQEGTMILEGSNATLFVQIRTVGVLVPCNSLKNLSSHIPLGLTHDTRFNMNTALLLRMESFTFSGTTVTSSNTRLIRLNPSLARPKRTQIIANAVVKGLIAGFDCLNYNSVVLSLEDDSLYKPSIMNHASISEADCRFVFVKESKPLPRSEVVPGGSLYGPSTVVGAVELTTAGLKFKLNAQLYSHVTILAKCVEMGQHQFTNIMDELSRQQLKEEANKPSPIPLRRARGGTVSMRSLPSPGIVDQIVRSGSSMQGSKASSNQSTFQLDVTLLTTAGALEFYSCTSASKLETSASGKRAKTGKSGKREGAAKDLSESQMDSSEGGRGGRPSSFKLGPTPPPKTNTTDYTLLVRVPLPQAKASFSKSYANAKGSARIHQLLHPQRFPSTLPKNTQTTLNSPINHTPSETLSHAASQASNQRHNVNMVAIVIEHIHCVVSPDLTIFYHELLAQISVVKTVIKEMEDEPESLSPTSPQTSSLPEAQSSKSDSTSNSTETEVPLQPLQASASSASVEQLDKEESWTVHFHLKPSSLVLSSTPYSETTCSLKIGEIIVMYQSAIIGSTNANNFNDALQRSILFQVESLALLMEHPHLEKDNNLASLEIGSVRLHGSHTALSSSHKRSSSGAPRASNPLTLLITMQSMDGFFSIRHLQETLLFIKVWQQGIYLSQYADFFSSQHPPVGGEAAESSTDEEETTGDSSQAGVGGSESSSTATGNTGNIGVFGLLLEESSILLNVELHAINLVSDLGPSLASVKCELDYVIASLSAPGKSKLDPLGEIFDLVVQAGPFNIVFKGNLDGFITLPRISMHGRRILSQTPLSKATVSKQPLRGFAASRRRVLSGSGASSSSGNSLNRSGLVEHPQLAGRSVWTGGIDPISTSLNYSLSPVLVFNTGEINVSAMDSWRKRELDEGDADDSDGEPNQTGFVWEPVTNVSATLGVVDLAISSETLSLPTNVAKRLADSIRKSNDKAKATLKSMDQLLVVRRDLQNMKTKAGIGMRPLERLQQLRSMANGSKIAFRPSVKDSHMGPSSKKIDLSSINKPLGTKSSSSMTKRLPIGNVTFTGNSLNIRMFSFSLRDPNWFDLTISSFQIALDQQVQKISLSDQEGALLTDGGGASRSTLSGSTGSVRRSSIVDSDEQSFVASASSSSAIVSVSRELSIVLGGAQLAKITEDRLSSTLEPRQAEQIIESIFVIPATTLVQLSSQDVGSLELEIYFMTQFQDSIRVSIKLNLYTELTNTVKSYQRVIENSKNVQIISQRTARPSEGSSSNALGLRSSRRHNKPGSSTGSGVKIALQSGTPLPLPSESKSKGSKFTIITTKAPSPNGVPTLKSTPAPMLGDTFKKSPRGGDVSSKEDPNKKEPERNFNIKKFDFNPSVDVLGDFTPKISTVLGWVGIKDAEKTIPKSIHILTDILEATLTEAHTASKVIAKQRQRWKDFAPSSRLPSASPSSSTLNESNL